MNIEVQFALSVAICYFVVAVFFKAVRDIIKFRFHWSIFDNIKWKWLRNYLTDGNPNAPRAVDGWHQADGGLVLAPMLLILYWGNRFIFHAPWWQLIVALFFAGWIFYIIFNFLYHYLFMKKEFKGQKVEPRV